MTTTAINFDKHFDISNVGIQRAQTNRILSNLDVLGIAVPGPLAEDLDTIEAVRLRVSETLAPRSTRPPHAVIVGAVGRGGDLDSTDVLLEVHESILRASGDYAPVIRQAGDLLDIQRSAAVDRHRDLIVDALRAASRPLISSVRRFTDSGSAVALDDVDAFTYLSVEQVSAFALARDANAALRRIAETVGALGLLMTPEVSCSGPLLWSPLTDEELDNLSRRYQIPGVDLRMGNDHAWRAIALDPERVDLASPEEYLTRAQAVSDQSAQAMDAHARGISDAWKGIVR